MRGQRKEESETVNSKDFRDLSIILCTLHYSLLAMTNHCYRVLFFFIIFFLVWAGHRLVGGFIISEHCICIYSIMNNPLTAKLGQR